MDEDAASGISDIEYADADGLVEAIPDHFPPNQEEELLEIAFSKDCSESDHRSARSKISHNKVTQIDLDLVKRASMHYLMEQAGRENSPL